MFTHTCVYFTLFGVHDMTHESLNYQSMIDNNFTTTLRDTVGTAIEHVSFAFAEDF